MFRCLILLIGMLPLATIMAQTVPTSPRAEAAAERVTGQLQADFTAAGLSWGSPLFIQIFKRDAILKLWVEAADGSYRMFRSYDICAYSGDLGPKLREGDGQSPEGFYSITPRQLNPASSFHLSFNLGFPNAYDRSYGRTGSYLMVHGDCVSIGCYAMGRREAHNRPLSNQPIEEIFTLMRSAFAAGQTQVPVHIFPFPLTGEALSAQQEHRWHSFWTELQPGWAAFEKSKTPPHITARGKTYIITPQS